MTVADSSTSLYRLKLSKAVAKLQPSGMARDEYHVSIMKEFIAAVKSRKASQELSDAARGAIFKEHMLERLPISPSEFQTMDELEASLQQKSEARLATVIRAACKHNVEVARLSQVIEPSP